MGFSVSGAAALVFVGLFVSFGMYYSASATSFERVTEAQQDRSEDVLASHNTNVTIVSATYDGSDQVTITVDNAGATQLRLSRSDVLVDGTYETGWADGADVDGNDGTDLWLSGERLTLTVDGFSTEPGRVKVVTASGVADTAEVTEP